MGGPRKNDRRGRCDERAPAHASSSALRRTASPISRQSADSHGPSDVVVIEMQGRGARYYTFVWDRAVLVARACRDAGVRVSCLDVPKPRGRNDSSRKHRKWGGFCRSWASSRLTIRHGITIGEISRVRRGRKGMGAVDGDRDERVPVSIATAHASARDATSFMPFNKIMQTYETASCIPGGASSKERTLRASRHDAALEITERAMGRTVKRLARARGTRDCRDSSRDRRVEPTSSQARKQSCGGRPNHVPTRGCSGRSPTYVALVRARESREPAGLPPSGPSDTSSSIKSPRLDLLIGSAETASASRGATTRGPSGPKRVSLQGDEERAAVSTRSRAAQPRGGDERRGLQNSDPEGAGNRFAARRAGC